MLIDSEFNCTTSRRPSDLDDAVDIARK